MTTQTTSSFDITLFGRVAVVFGGYSAERAVSLNSGQAVLTALNLAGVHAEAFDPSERDIMELRQFDRAFIVLHGRGGEDGQLQGLLQWLGVPYTGSGVMASALGMDKVRTKQLWLGCGLPTARYILVDEFSDSDEVIRQVGLPLIIKPVCEGSSIGMCKVETIDQLKPAIEKAAVHDTRVMAESWIEGLEFTIVILNDHALPIIRLQPPSDASFYDYDAKYLRNDTQYGIPCGLTPEEEKHLQQLALQAFRAVGATGWGRIDAMQHQDGEFMLLEINTVPGMTDHSLVPMAAKAIGLDFGQLCLTLLAQTLVQSSTQIHG